MAKVITVVGNRPQFVKLGVTARRLRELGAAAPFESVVVNTGQHYDTMLADVFFSELQIEAPQYSLGIGSGQIVDQVGKMLAPLREIFDREQPSAILVYGDTNSTLAAAIVAAHADIPLIHVEGGERLYRRSAMPEEVNRVVTDHLADICLASSRKAVDYLLREGMGPERAVFVGDPMYDIFKMTGETLKERPAAQPEDYGLEPGGYVISTMHRAENTDSREAGIAIMEALDAAPLPILLPAHPRLRSRLDSWGWRPRNALRLIEPLGYFDFQSLLRGSGMAVSDSGGVGREAFFAGKGCIVPLESSAWIEAVEAGMAVMVGSDPERLRDALATFRPRDPFPGFVEDQFGSGDAGARIVEAIDARITGGPRRTEGPWHPVARFGQLPRSADATMRTHRAFVEHAAQAAARDDGIAFDLGESLAGAVDLGALAAELGLAVRLIVRLGALRYNLFAPDALATVRRLIAQGHVLAADAADRAVLAAVFASPIDDIPTAPTVDDLAQGSVLRPWLWGRFPTARFESALRLVDAGREAQLDRLRADHTAPALGDGT